MSMRDFKQRVLEQQIFDELKDTSIRSAEYFKAKYEGADIDYSRLYRRIVNYQIKEYGHSLNTNAHYVPRRTYQECLKDQAKHRQRKYSRLGLKRNLYEKQN